MKEVRQKLEIIDDESGELVYHGSYVVRVPKRVERTALQMKMQKLDGNDGTEAYLQETERLLDSNLVSIDVTHSESGQKITSREDLEYLEAENLIAHIMRTIIGGESLGKRIKS